MRYHDSMQLAAIKSTTIMAAAATVVVLLLLWKTSPGSTPLGPRQIPNHIHFNYKISLLAPPRALDAAEHLLRRNVLHTIALFRDVELASIRFLSDAECLALLARFDPTGILVWGFEHENDGRYKSDMCRLAQLHEEGGFCKCSCGCQV